MELTPSFRLLLQHFRPVFTTPSFRLFVLLITGWALSCRHRYITECIFTAGQVGIGHWSCYHRFLSHYAWSLDGLCQVLAQRLIERFAPDGPILLAGDDTLCRKRGLGLFGAGRHHDPLFSSKALKVFSWGHDWVVLALLVRLPHGKGKRPDHRFYGTRLDWSARDVLSAYASRGALEVTFEGGKQVLGLEDPAKRLPQAVPRTAPLALVLYSLIVLWFDTVGQQWVCFPQRPWYRRKRESSFQDMVTTLRRKSWEEKLAEVVSPSRRYKKWLASVSEWAARVG